MKKMIAVMVMSVLMPLGIIMPSFAAAAELPLSLRAQISATLTGTQIALTNVSMQLGADAQTTLMLRAQLASIAAQLQLLVNALPQVDTDVERQAVSATLSGVATQVSAATNVVSQMQARRAQHFSVLQQLVAKFTTLVQLVIQHRALP